MLRKALQMLDISHPWSLHRSKARSAAAVASCDERRSISGPVLLTAERAQRSLKRERGPKNRVFVKVTSDQLDPDGEATRSGAAWNRCSRMATQIQWRSVKRHGGGRMGDDLCGAQVTDRQLWCCSRNGWRE